MRRLIMALALLGLAGWQSGDVGAQVGGAGGIQFSGSYVPTTGGTLTGPLLLPAGSAAAPSLGIGAATYGLFATADSVRVSANGIARASFDDSGRFSLIQDSSLLRFGAGVDLILGREAAANLQLGSDAATATAQTISAADSTGAGIAGASLTLAGGSGGAGGATGAVIIGSPHLTGSGTKTLVDNTATAFARVDVADDDFEACTLTYAAYAEDADGDARQVRNGIISIAILNNSGTEAATFSTGDSAVGVTAGTFTCTFDGNSAVNNTIDIRATCNTSLDAAAETLTLSYLLVCPGTTVVTAQ